MVEERVDDLVPETADRPIPTVAVRDPHEHTEETGTISPATAARQTSRLEHGDDPVEQCRDRGRFGALHRAAFAPPDEIRGLCRRADDTMRPEPVRAEPLRCAERLVITLGTRVRAGTRVDTPVGAFAVPARDASVAMPTVRPDPLRVALLAAVRADHPAPWAHRGYPPQPQPCANQTSPSTVVISHRRRHGISTDATSADSSSTWRRTALAVPPVTVT